VSSDYDFADLNNECGFTGSMTVTYTVSDDCENSVTITGTLTIIDTTPPSLTTCEPDNLDLTYECNSDLPNEETADAWDEANQLYLSQCASDLCGEVHVSSNYAFEDLSNECGFTGSMTVTYTVSDDCENSVTITGTLTIVDTTPPSLTTCDPDNLDLTYECNSDLGNEETADAWDAANQLYLSQCASDLCGDVHVSSNYAFEDLSNECGFTGSMTVTYTVSDDCENSVTITGTLTIVDTTPPSLTTCEPDNLDLTYECNSDLTNEETADAWDVANQLYLSQCASDLCGDVHVSSDYDFADLSNECGFTGSMTVTYTVSDDCENSVTITGTLTIIGRSHD
jgi:hypothetical protein